MKLAGGLRNFGTVELEAGRLDAYRLSAGSTDVFDIYNSSETRVKAGTVQVETSVSSNFPDSLLTIDADHLTVKADGQYDKGHPADPGNGIREATSPDALASLQDVGTIWTGLGGQLEVRIADGGSLTAKTQVHKMVPSRTEVESFIRDYKRDYPDYAAKAEEGLQKEDRLDIHLGQSAAWNVTGDSSASTVENMGLIDLSVNEMPVGLTVKKLTGNGHIILGEKAETVSHVTAESATGSVTLDMMPEDTENPEKKEYDKVEVLSVTSPEGGFAVIPGHFYKSNGLL